MSITLGNIIDKVVADIPQLTQKKEVIRALNRVIGDINRKWEGQLKTAVVNTKIAGAQANTLTFTAATKTIVGTVDFHGSIAVDDVIYISGTLLHAANATPKTVATASGQEIITVNEAVSSQSAVVCLYDLFRLAAGFSWGKNDYLLTLPDTVKKVFSVFHNDAELEKRPYEFTKDSYNASELIYCRTDRNKIYLPSGLLAAANDYITLKYISTLAKITDFDSDTVIDAPDDFEGLLIAGVLQCLLVQSQYRDPELYKFNAEIYAQAINDMNIIAIKRFPQTTEDKEYNY